MRKLIILLIPILFACNKDFCIAEYNSLLQGNEPEIKLPVDNFCQKVGIKYRIIFKAEEKPILNGNTFTVTPTTINNMRCPVRYCDLIKSQL